MRELRFSAPSTEGGMAGISPVHSVADCTFSME